MRLSAFLPTRLRRWVGARVEDTKNLRHGFVWQLRPTATSRHTPEELKARTDQWIQDRAQWEQDATSGAESLRARFRTLQIQRIHQQTHDAITLYLKNDGLDPISFHPGQYITLILEIDGQEVRRAYSMCSDPEQGEQLAVTVKRVKNGLVSNYIHDHLEEGMSIKVLGPNGQFGTTPAPEQERHLVLIAGGSGITPVFSILNAILKREPKSHVTLVFANRSAKDIIFHKELTALEQDFTQLSIRYLLEESSNEVESIEGRLEGKLLPEALPIDSQAEYYICGPAQMMDNVTQFLDESGIPEEHISLERFVAQRKDMESKGESYTLRFQGTQKDIDIKDTETLLEAGIRAGISMSYSCQMGGCGHCKVKIISGQVEMEEPNCLTREEKARGECLACIARPISSITIEN